MPANPMKVRFDEDNLDHLERQALQIGRPITTVINRVIDSARTSISLNAFFQAVEPPPLLRLRTSSTTADVSRLCNIITSGSLTNIVFGASKDQNNGRVLTGYVEVEGCIVLFDGTLINHARDPRIWEVETLVRALARFSNSFSAGLIDEVAPLTKHLDVGEAWAKLSDLTVVPFSIKSFLNVIAPNQEHDNLLRYAPTDKHCITVEREVDYGRNELVHLHNFESEAEAMDNFDRLLTNSKWHSAEGEHMVFYSHYDRPQKWGKIVKPTLPGATVPELS